MDNTRERRRMRLDLPMVGVVAALPLVVFAVLMIVFVGGQQKRQSTGLAEFRATAAAQDVDERLLAVRSALAMLSTSNVFEDRSEATTARILRALAASPDLIAMEVQDGAGRTDHFRADGTVLSTSAATPAQGSVSAVRRTGEPQITGVLTDAWIGAEPAVAVSVPIFFTDRPSSILTAYVRAWTVNQALGEQPLPAGWDLSVIDGTGRLVTTSAAETPDDPAIGLPAAAPLRSGPAPDAVARGEGGEREYFFSAPSLVTGWMVVLRAPAAAIEGATRSTAIAVSGGGLAALLLAISIGRTLIRSHAEREEAERRVAAVEAAAAAERRTASILESTTDAVAEIGRDWRITFVNRRGLDLLAPDHDPIGRTLWDEFPEAVGTVFWDQYQRAMRERVPVEFTAPAPKQGLWLSIRAFPSEGGLAVYFRDVTERRRLERDLARHRALLDGVMETLPVGVFVINGDGKILQVNSAGRAIWGGWRQVGIEGYGEYKAWWHDSGRPLDADDWAAAHAVLRGEAVLGHVIDIEAFDGSRKTIRNSALPVVDERGRRLGAVVVVEDITERLAADKALRDARDEAERAVLSKSRFLAAASHDMRQPLQSLFLFAGVLRDHVAGEQGQATLGNLEDGLETLRSLLDSLLDVSRLDAEVVQPLIGDYPLQPLLEQLSASYEPVARAKGLDWRMSSVSCTVRSDRVLLGRVLRNLVENAIKFTEQGLVAVACRVEGDKAVIQVADTGIGIPPGQLDAIFEEFHQVGNIERDRSRGYGLGLAVVRRIAHLLDHPVRVASDLGRGSTFTVEVPVVADPGPQPGEEDAGVQDEPSGIWGRCVAVIEDDAIVLLGLRTILAAWKCEVIAAASGAQILERLRDAGRTPDLIIADYRLRDGEVGTDAILAVRDMLGQAVPGILVTGETGPDCRRKAAEYGLGLMHKPVTPRQLRAALESWLEKQDARGAPD